MTGTALTEAEEFNKIYKLDVSASRRTSPSMRDDHSDFIYQSEEGKFRAVVERDQGAPRGRASQCWSARPPSRSPSTSLSCSNWQGIPHNVLNAKQHAREAHVVAQAGRSGAVTIATNMAGRGTDIMLGGNPDEFVDEILRERDIDPEFATEEDREEALDEAKRRCDEDRENVVAAGGLYIIGTERHEARRIDNQLRGRSGRQGDPGESRFFVSLRRRSDAPLRLRPRRRASWAASGMDDDMPLESKHGQRHAGAGADQGRGRQLRHPQECRRV